MSVLLTLPGCGDDGGSKTDGGSPVDAATDVRSDTGPDVAPDIAPDTKPPCYECISVGGPGTVCRPNQDAPPGCVFGTGEAGDLCSSTCAEGLDCVRFQLDSIGFCAPACTTDPECSEIAGVCRMDSDRPPDGVADHCLWSCETVEDCPSPE